MPEKDLKAYTDAMILIHDSSSISMKEKLNNKKFNLFYLDLFHENLSYALLKNSPTIIKSQM